MEITIKELVDDAGLNNSVPVIRESFQTVAVEFNLTKENCPTHPSFVTATQLKELKMKGQHFFALFSSDAQVGFVAVQQAEKTISMEKLAVLPAHRHRGYGLKMAQFVLDYARKNGGTKLSIGIIDEHTVLKNWYIGIGFKVTAIKRFSHLPFTVCLMERDVSNMQGGYNPAAIRT